MRDKAERLLSSSGEATEYVRKEHAGVAEHSAAVNARAGARRSICDGPMGLFTTRLPTRPFKRHPTHFVASNRETSSFRVPDEQLGVGSVEAEGVRRTCSVRI